MIYETSKEYIIVMKQYEKMILKCKDLGGVYAPLINFRVFNGKYQYRSTIDNSKFPFVLIITRHEKLWAGGYEFIGEEFERIVLPPGSLKFSIGDRIRIKMKELRFIIIGRKKPLFEE